MPTISGSVSGNATVSLRIDPGPGEQLGDPVNVDSFEVRNGFSAPPNLITTTTITETFSGSGRHLAKIGDTIGASISFNESAFLTGAPVSVQVVFSLAPASDLKPTLDWDSAGGVDVGYTVAAAATPAGTTEALYWGDASGNRLGGPIPGTVQTIAANTAPGTYGPVHFPAAGLGAMPHGATQLLAVVDPDNIVAESAETNNVRALALPDLSPELEWNTSGGVKVGYEVDGDPGAQVLADTTAVLYWSSTDQFAGHLGGPIAGTSQTITAGTPVGSYGPIPFPAATLGAPPAGARYLVAVVDLDDTVAEPDETNNDQALALLDLIASVSPLPLTESGSPAVLTLTNPGKTDRAVTSITWPDDGPFSFTPQVNLPTANNPLILAPDQSIDVLEVALDSTWLQDPANVPDYEAQVLYSAVRVTDSAEPGAPISAPVVGFVERVDAANTDSTLTFRDTVSDGSGGIERSNPLLFENFSKDSVTFDLEFASGEDFKSGASSVSVGGNSTSSVSLSFAPSVRNMTVHPIMELDQLTLTAGKSTPVPPITINLAGNDSPIQQVAVDMSELGSALQGLSDDLAQVRDQILQDLPDFQQKILADLRQDYADAGVAAGIQFTPATDAGPGVSKLVFANVTPLTHPTLAAIDLLSPRFGWAASGVDIGQSVLDATKLPTPGYTPNPADFFRFEQLYNGQLSGEAYVFLTPNFVNGINKAVHAGNLDPNGITDDGLARLFADTGAHEVGHLLGMVHELGNPNPANLMTDGKKVGNIAHRYGTTRSFTAGPDPQLVPDSLRVALRLPVDPDEQTEASRLPALLNPVPAVALILNAIFSSLSTLDGFSSDGPVSSAPAGYAGVGPPDTGSGFVLMQQNPESAQTTLQWNTPFDNTISGFEFQVNALANTADLTPGRHFLDAVLLGPSGEIPLAHIDLASLVYGANANPLGEATGWFTVNLAADDEEGSALVPGVEYQLQLQLTSDQGLSGEHVAVAIANLSAYKPYSNDTLGTITTTSIVSSTNTPV
jgi:hypothetical protein